MREKTILWSNKVWAIWMLGACQCSTNCKASSVPCMMVEKKTTGECDYPIRLAGEDARNSILGIVYDYPERIPPYIKKQVFRQFKKI